ncbi:hypothetical protein [Spirosoma validum]|uniref:Uncharacterized protein n=1 Tax=Spirosoma validum TaxID=2771355 RepID=A0A927B0Q1_9BACT|nr:hypothetical protein [Spirosoma validum]MBD2753394.1 hypothetical protein [Spirosoma validum]
MKAIVDTIEQDTWMVRGWKIKFILSDKLLHQAKLLSRVDHWYDDPIVADTYIEKMAVCFNSIQQFHHTFGLLPQVGDRLYNEESGVIVQDRSIDGGLKHITFRVSI